MKYFIFAFGEHLSNAFLVGDLTLGTFKLLYTDQTQIKIINY